MRRRWRGQRQRSGPPATQLPGEFDALARTIAEPTPDQRRDAVRFVASAASDVADCRLLLHMLGLDAREGRTDGRIKAIEGDDDG